MFQDLFVFKNPSLGQGHFNKFKNKEKKKKKNAVKPS